ncbi:MAG TPA: hypothetical protein VJ913_11950, partial [Actinomycetota bacterium]|nr:hypothetical protein [Actinomycetota bacterium]
MMERAGRAAPAVAALTLLLAAGTVVLFTFDGAIGSDPASNVLMLVAVVCYAVVGGLIASRLPKNACGWLLLLIGLGLVVSMGAEAATMVAFRDGRTVIATWTFWINSWFLVATVWPGVVLYLLVFPTGAPPSRRWRPVAIGVIALAVAGVLVRIAQPWAGEPVTNPTELPGLSSAADTLFVAISLAFAGAGIVAVASIVVRFRGASSSDRQALRWLAVVGMLAASLLVVAIAAGALGLHRVGDPFGAAFLVALVLGLPASAAVALLGHHLHGLEVVANRSLVSVSVVAAITAIYGVIVAGVGAVVGGGERTNVVAAVVATAVAAIVFQPARRRAHRLADRLIYGDRASPYELLATFGERLDEASLREVLPRMTRLVADGTGAVRVRIWLRNGSDLRAVAQWPTGVMPSPMQVTGDELPSSDDPVFAVRHGGDLLGAITV